MFSIIDIFLFKLGIYLKQTFNIDIFILKLKITLQVDFLNLCIYLKTLKCTKSRLTSNIDAFILKLRTILEVDFLHLCIYVQVQKYISSLFPKLMFFFQTQSILAVYFISTKVRRYNINEVLLKYKQSTFYFFPFLYSIQTSFRKFT